MKAYPTKPRHLNAVETTVAERWMVYLPIPAPAPGVDARAWHDVTREEAFDLIALGDWVRVILPDGTEMVGADEILAAFPAEANRRRP